MSFPLIDLQKNIYNYINISIIDVLILIVRYKIYLNIYKINIITFIYLKDIKEPDS